MIIGILIGIFSGSMVQKQVSYCECLRDDFKGAYCESIKGAGTIGSCHK